MNTFTNEPKFTAFALNELSAEEAAQFRKELLSKGVEEKEINDEVKHLQTMQATLNEEFAKDDSVRLAFDKREEILRSSEKKSLFSMFRIPGFIFALSICVIVFKFKDVGNQRLEGLTSSVFTKSDTWVQELDGGNQSTTVLEEAEPVAEIAQYHAYKGGKQVEMKIGRARMVKKKILAPTASNFMISDMPAPDFNREGYDHIEANDYILVSAQPLSTFSIDVDTASYSNVRRFIDSGRMPPKSSIRLEELINYFPYDYKMDHNDHPVAVKVDQSESPFHKGRRLVRIAMKASTPQKSVGKNLVFLLDVSGSMNSANKLPLLKESLKIVMRELKPTDTISLVVYAGAAGVVLPPTPVKERLKIRQALNNLSAGGSTNGGAGITAAYDLAKEAFIEGGVNRVILATDGDFNVGTSSRGGLVDLVKEKAKDNIFLTVLGFGMGNYQDAMLEEISNKGNGNFAYIDNLSEANKVFKYDLEKNMTTVAKDVKLQVEFNPKFVQAYRLIGYENRVMAAKDFNDDKKDAGEVGAGHTVTALYEVIGHDEKMPLPKVDKLKYAAKPKKEMVANNSKELLNVKVRYKKPTSSFSTKFEVPLVNKKLTELKPDSEMVFASSVAAWGLKLRGDEMAKNISYREIRDMAKRAKGRDPLGFRSEFVELIDFTIGLSK